MTESADRPDPPLLELDEISVMRGDRLVLDRFSLRIGQGQHTAILGPNGSGKSTLLGLLTREFYPQSGHQVRILGRARWSVADLKQVIGIVSPSLHADLAAREPGRGPLTAFDAVASAFFGASGVWRHHVLTESMRHRTEAALARTGIDALAGRDMATLSTGEARRVLIARALVHEPRALFLDEPCGGLDPGARRQFLETLRGLARGGTTLIMVTHHVEEILPEIDHVVTIKHGRVTGDDAKARLLDPALLSRLFDAGISVECSGGWYAARVG
ncbi:ABC transporter ATP-binding protein [Sphingosinicella sp. BN140058]|uniref:ABC transporter ATP-binding protein n=1 Tax=Sphingosinicella sp. BN140058 TaxID=1892855 RepID=UPI0010114036|nr:ATP-binding cassette domain-containing protein [Sphingosinicella sp. BN140058]QAY75397.1 ATP-binding cassette domain-containing protein [Sphingosinicella sp. BN140058]